MRVSLSPLFILHRFYDIPHVNNAKDTLQPESRCSHFSCTTNAARGNKSKSPSVFAQTSSPSSLRGKAVNKPHSPKIEFKFDFSSSALRLFVTAPSVVVEENDSLNGAAVVGIR